MIFILLLIGLSSFSLSGMQVPVVGTSERRPIEESMFELHAQTNERLDNLEYSISTLENLARETLLNNATEVATEKVKRVCTDAVLQDLVLRADAKASLFASEQQEDKKRIVADIQLVNAQIRQQKAQQESKLVSLVGDHQENNGAVKADLEALKAQLQEQNRQQEAAQLQLKAELQQLRAGNVQLAAELEAQKSSTKKAYLVGGAACIIAAGTAMYLGARIACHDRDLYGCQELQVKSLADQVAELEKRPWQSKDNNNHLVYHDSNGDAPIKGAHVSAWK